MTEPALTANIVSVTDAMKTHPLATRSGISMMVNLLEAGQVWSKCTKPQQRLLSELCPPVVDQLMQAGQLMPDQLPELPFKIGESTRNALRLRGLIDDRDRLTGRAVHTWFYAGRTKDGGGAS